MGFLLAGLILRAPDGPRPVAVASAVPLAQGFELLRVEGDRGMAGFDRLTEEAVAAAETLSATRRVVHVEAEFFGGEGSQGAIGWEDGRVAFGPRLTQTPLEDRGDEYEVIAEGGDLAIDEALRWLGVVADEGKDEFATLRLDDLDELRRA